MKYDPVRRDSSWQLIQPGCYLDPRGIPHIFPDEILAFLSAMHPEIGFDPESRKDYELVLDVYTEQMRKICPGLEIRIVRHEREKH